MSYYPQPPQGPYPSFPPPQPETPSPRKYNFIVGMLLSFMPDVWKDVGRGWKGVCFFYMLILLLVTWIPSFIRGQANINKFVTTDAPPIIDQIPHLIVTNGVLTCDKREPYTITDPGTGRAVVVIDTTGGTTEPPPAPSMLLTRTTAVIAQTSKTETHSLAGMNFSFDAPKAREALNKLKELFLPVGFPVMVVLSFIWRFICMLILAAIGMAFKGGNQSLPNFAGGMRLAAIAMTPMIFIDALLAFFPIPSLGCVWFFVEVGVAIGIMAAAVKATGPTPPMMAMPPMTPPSYQ